MGSQMSRNVSLLPLSVLLFSGTSALADVPRVATDIAPVHSLVAMIMKGVGEPDLVLAPGASPHEYSLRPSEAATLQDAQLVFWTSADLTPWLENAVDTLAGDAKAIELLEVDGTVRLPYRESALFEAHDHDEAEHSHEHDHGHDHDGHSESDAGGHEDAAEKGGHAHSEDGHDPHAWLSLGNASVWLDVISVALGEIDPDNAGTYSANAKAAKTEIEGLRAEISAILEPVRGQNFVVFHDAYQYFEHEFDFPASGAISISDATDPSPARIAEVRARVEELGVSCVLSEPQFDPGLVATVLDGSDARGGVVDPLGSELETSSDFYPKLMRNLAKALADCL